MTKPRIVQRQLAVVGDRLLGLVGLVRRSQIHHAETGLLREGRVLLDKKIRGQVIESVDLGKNTIMDSMRVIVAKLLARKAYEVQGVISGATFPLGIDGYNSTDPVFPVHLYIGTSADAATAEDTRLGYYLTQSDTSGSNPIRFSLSRVTVRSSKSEYTNVLKPINVGFEFDIPAGTLRSGGDAETSPYSLMEFGLSDNNGGNYPITGAPAVLGDPQTTHGSPPTQLARKVAHVVKLFEMSFTVRWEIRT